jgi:hypothetical protein
MLVLRLGDFEGCHSEERSDEESPDGRNTTRFFAFTMFRLRMTPPHLHTDRLLETCRVGSANPASW